MLSDNIRKYRKSNHMSQDELAEKLEVTRQSISLWETGQTQPSLDNIVALAKLFDVSTDALLTDNVPETSDTVIVESQSNKPTDKKKTVLITSVCCLVLVAVIFSCWLYTNEKFGFNNDNVVLPDSSDIVHDEDVSANDQPDVNNESHPKLFVKNDNENDSQGKASETVKDNLHEKQENSQPTLNTNNNDAESQSIKAEDVKVNLSVKQETENDKNQETQSAENDSNSNKDSSRSEVTENTENVVDAFDKTSEKDIYSYLKNFVIQNGIINGDYCYISKSADNYGGYSSEDFSLYYWGDTEKIEFCLHSVLDETFSINFFLYVPAKHTGKYEYISSYYFRDTGEPLYEAKGMINAKDFTKNYPLNCYEYIGSSDAQNDFMEMSRQGVCDLIDCIKKFVQVENLEYSFADFGFINF